MRFTLLALVIVSLLSCNRNVVNLEYTNAKNEVPRLGNLVFRFSNPLVADSMLNEWDSTAYIKFTPAISGRFRWQNANELVFSPSQPLPPATSFKANFTDELTASSKYASVSDDQIEFYTPALKLEDVQVTWVNPGDKPGTASPQIDLYFNYPVAPDQLKDKLKIEIEGKEVAYNISTLSEGSKISVALQQTQVQDKDLAGKILIAEGVVPQGGVNATKETIASNYMVPSPFNLVINNLVAEHDGLSGTVTVHTSQQLASNDISSLINIQPAVKFTVQSSDEGFILKSDQFSSEKSYSLKIKKGVRGRIGGVLQEEYENSIVFGEMEPSVNFSANKSIYLAAQGNRMVEVKIVNVPKVKVVISKVYESNLLAARNYGYEPRETRTGNDDNDYDYYSDGLSMGDVIYEKEIDTRSLPQAGGARLFSFNVEDRLPDFKGIYHIRIRSMQNYWISDSRFVSISDVGLIAKEGRDKLFVFANSLRSTEPLENVNIVAYGNNNQVLGLGATNKDGVAQISYTRKEFAGFKPAMIIAKTENDFNYLPFNSTRVNMSRFETGGKRINSTGLDGFIYPERDVYRPGERINFSVIVRDVNWKIPGEIPLRFRLLLPNGKEYRTFRKTLNDQGSTEGQIDISPAAITGTYSLEVYTSNDVLIGTQAFSIEEFVPDRIKVTSTLNKSDLKSGESTTLAIDAVNFFGPPAAGRNYETEIQLKAKNFSPKKYSQYLFGIKNKALSLDKVFRQGKLDEQGKAEEKYEVPAMFNNSGLLQADFYTTVFDETGRPVSKAATANVFTQQLFLGVGDDGYWYYPLNQQMRVPLIALDKNEKPLSNAKAVVRVIKHEYRTVLSKAGEYFRYESQEEDKIVAEQNVTISGENTAYSFVPRSPGNYEIRVSLPDASGYVSRSFYSYGSWGGNNNSFEVNTDGNIDIETDKSVYRPGEKAKVLFKSPFNGRMLVSVEQDKVISYQYINVENRTASIDLPLTEAHLPNIFITATLIKSHTVSDIPLTVAHGFQNVKVEDKGRLNKVEIISAKTTRSKSRQEITVKASPGSYVTLAAVDNGVLQVTDFKSPDPFEYFYASRALQVDAYDLYPFLFPEVRARLSSTGGDGEMSMQKRVNPMPAKRVQIVSYWSGITKTNGNGQAKFTVDVPRFSGQLRLMAVAYNDNSFGAAEEVLTVADPIVVSTGLPRFLSPGDSIAVPVTLTNTTAAATTANVTIKTIGPITVKGELSRSVNLAPNSEGRVTFTAAASSAIDTGKIIIDVKAGNEKTGEEIAIGVRPASPLLVMHSAGIVAGGNSQKINGFQNDFLAGTASYKLTVSKSPVMELGEQLRYLLRYPYGCTEQVVSAAFPQLYYGEIAAHVSGQKSNSANQNVIEAIRKIKLRQLYNGALTLWDNEGTESWWTTIYATHFLIEAKKAGFDVDESLLNTMLNYINNRLRNKQTITYLFNRDQRKKIAPKEVAYSLYVLSLASRPNISAMNYYKANTAVLSLDSKYLLGASYAIAGDRKKFAELLPISFSGEESVPESGGSFYSPIRDEAIALSALIEVDPQHAQIPVMARHVATQLKNRQWYSTQECSFSLLALGKLAKLTGANTVTADVKENGKVVASFKGNEVTYSAKQINDLQITAKGEGRLFYYLQAEGVSSSGQYKEEDSYIKVRKQFFDRFGRRIENNTFKRNDLIVVQVTLDRLFNSDIENIVVTDLLPAGFEIENPRTKEIPGMDWIINASMPTQLDVRDDRIHLFVDLLQNRQVYYYAVRAVSPGKFRMGPIGADAMYNGEYHSYHGAGTIEINE